MKNVENVANIFELGNVNSLFSCESVDGKIIHKLFSLIEASHNIDNYSDYTSCFEVIYNWGELASRLGFINNYGLDFCDSKNSTKLNLGGEL